MALKDNVLKFSKGAIERAGKALAEETTYENEKAESLEILNNFRACHAYPLNTFQATLRDKINAVKFKNYLVPQRLKRTPSIIFKLQRETLRLPQMQDIGGLRAILSDIDEVNTLVRMYKASKFQHKIKNEKDYLTYPKSSGYRGYHIIYQYKNSVNSNYDGLFIELQIRTKLQHAWATAVETMGTFIQHSLKSSQGPDEYLTFFALVANAFAIVEETPSLSQYSGLSEQEVYNKIKSDAEELQIIPQLEAFNKVVSNIETDKKQGSLHLVVLDVTNKSVNVKTYPKNAVEQASLDYLREESIEQDGTNRQVVLVSSTSIETLKKAYPSYFLDTEEFIKRLNEIIKKAN